MKRLIALALGGIALFVGALPAGGAADRDVQPMRWHTQTGLPHGTPVAAAAVAKLVRTENGVSYAITTGMLQPGHAYTVWLVVVNYPEACAASPCSAGDIITNPATDAQVTYGTGHVVGMSGRAGFGGTQRKGPIPEGWLPDQGLDEPLGAEVHLVINDHGPTLDGYMPEQIHTYRAGCTDASLPAIFPDTAKADGTPGPNTCRLTQFVVFQ
jgi:hypothetical protein